MRVGLSNKEIEIVKSVFKFTGSYEKTAFLCYISLEKLKSILNNEPEPPYQKKSVEIAKKKLVKNVAMIPAYLLGEYSNTTEYQMIYHKIRRDQLRKAVIRKLGNKCKRCSFKDIRALQIDHIHGGGVKELKTLRRERMYLNILEDKEKNKYQLLCANCNWIKRYENKECQIKNEGVIY